MGIFDNNRLDRNVPPKQPDQKTILELRYKGARNNLLWVVIFTAVNMLLVLTKSTMYFLFSASVPYYLTYFGLLYTGKMPAEVYEEIVPEGYVFVGYDDSFLTATLIISVLCVVFYLFCWIFSKKNRVGWIIAALVFFAIDTIAMFCFVGFSANLVLDIIFHIWVLFFLCNGIASHFKLKKLPVTEVTVEENAVACEVIADDVAHVNNAGAEVSAEISENPAENRVEVNDDANFV